MERMVVHRPAVCNAQAGCLTPAPLHLDGGEGGELDSSPGRGYSWRGAGGREDGMPVTHLVTPGQLPDQ
jgi:hypothetical protein